MKSEENYDLIYKPLENWEPKALPATIGVKFSNDIFLMKSFLDQHKIEYKESDLDYSPFGKGIRIKRSKN